MTITLIISAVSLALSAIALYVTQLRRPRIQCHIGPDIKIYYGNFNGCNSTGIYLPVTFINTAPNTGSIVRVSILIRADTSPQELYLMRWDQFVKMEADTYDYHADEPEHALAIEGKSALSKIIRFFWFATSKPNLILREGAYQLRLYFWEHEGKKPRIVYGEFYINDYLYRELEDCRQNKSSAYVQVLLSKELEPNRILSDDEARKLLGT